MARSKSRTAKRASARKPARKPAHTAAAKKKSARKSEPSVTASRKSATRSVAKGRGMKAVGKSAARPKKARPKTTRQSTWVTVPDPGIPGEDLRVSVPAGSARPADDRDEAAYNTQVLEDNRQISRSGAMRPGETHAIEETPEGERRLVRKRYSAI